MEEKKRSLDEKITLKCKWLEAVGKFPRGFLSSKRWKIVKINDQFIVLNPERIDSVRQDLADNNLDNNLMILCFRNYPSLASYGDVMRKTKEEAVDRWFPECPSYDEMELFLAIKGEDGYGEDQG